MKPTDTLVMPTAKEMLATRACAAIAVVACGPDGVPPECLRDLMAPALRYEHADCLKVATQQLAAITRALLYYGDEEGLVLAYRDGIEALPPRVIERLSAEIEESRYHAEGLL